MAAQKQPAARVEEDARSSSTGDAAASPRARSPRKTARSRSAEDGLSAELDRFISDHPDGWNHDDWLGLLGTLRERGYETSDQDAVGLALESRRQR